jgi:hypothetical protein
MEDVRGLLLSIIFNYRYQKIVIDTHIETKKKILNENLH